MIREGNRCFASKASKKAFDEIVDKLRSENEDAVLFDGLEDALIGVGHRFGAGAVAVYDRAKIIDLFIKRDKMTREDAEEHFGYNVIGTGVEHSPMFVEIEREVMTIS